jgi:hypothetical protein
MPQGASTNQEQSLKENITTWYYNTCKREMKEYADSMPFGKMQDSIRKKN